MPVICLAMSSQDPISTCIPLEVAASAFAALGSEQRLSVLRTLVRAGPDGLSIGDLGERSGVTGSTLTHHLRILSQARLVQQTRQGRSTICAAVAYREIEALTTFLLSECCTDTACGVTSHQHVSLPPDATPEVPHG